MYNNYKNYQQARDASWKILLDCGVDSLPVDVLDIARQLGVRVFSYEQGARIIRRHKLQRIAERTDGFSFVVCGSPIVFFNAGTSRQRARFTIAHELGHICLNHLEWNRPTVVNREPGPHDNPRETASAGACLCPLGAGYSYAAGHCQAVRYLSASRAFPRRPHGRAISPTEISDLASGTGGLPTVPAVHSSSGKVKSFISSRSRRVSALRDSLSSVVSGT